MSVEEFSRRMLVGTSLLVRQDKVEEKGTEKNVVEEGREVRRRFAWDFNNQKK
jgi:hypothetical protein